MAQEPPYGVMMSETQVLVPVPAAERLEEVDLLRGWALLGILLVNMNYFAWPIFTIFLKRQWENPADLWAEIAIGLFAQGKFYTLFSFLFGFGFSIFLLKGRYGPAVTLPFVFAIYFAEMALSVWWLKRFQFGPAEWLWRSLTYGRWQPTRA